jgi:hypothetical protein
MPDLAIRGLLLIWYERVSLTPLRLGCEDLGILQGVYGESSTLDSNFMEISWKTEPTGYEE